MPGTDRASPDQSEVYVPFSVPSTAPDRPASHCLKHTSRLLRPFLCFSPHYSYQALALKSMIM